jgi:diguanylate cyclase (GGDEF)-like protein
MEDDLAAMQARVAEMEEDLRNTEKQVVTNVGVNVGEVEDLRQKINILVGKINQLNIALQSREELFKSFSRIIESPGLDATYMAITGEAISLVPSQTAVLFILEESESGPLLFARAADTPYKNLFIDFTAVPGDGPVGWAAKHRQPVVIKNSDIKLKSGEELSTLLTYEKSALVTPVFFNEELTGVLYLGKPEVGAYTEKELLLINSYCRLAGPIIHTARVFSKATQVSLADETTGLFNEKYFSQRFLEEVARSRRYQIPLTLVMIEIINYARFAQSAEKAVQDRLIRDLSDVLRVHIRETDLAARLEDNRFAILFLHSQKKDTILISERIRMSAEMRSFGTPQAKQAGLKMAVGLANLPEDSQESDELYSLAQKCTDDSRIRGGNQTVFVS